MRWVLLSLFLVVSCTCSNVQEVADKVPEGNPTNQLGDLCAEQCGGARFVKTLTPQCECSEK